MGLAEFIKYCYILHLLPIGGPDGGASFGPKVLIVSPTSGYQTIQSAITAGVALTPTATDPVVVFIAPGTYTENLTLADFVYLASVGDINDAVNVVGTITYTPVAGGIFCAEGVTFTSSGRSVNFTITGTNASTVNFNNFSFSGNFIVNNPSVDVYVYNSQFGAGTITVTDANVTFVNSSIISPSGGIADLVGGVGTLTLQNCISNVSFGVADTATFNAVNCSLTATTGAFAAVLDLDPGAFANVSFCSVAVSDQTYGYWVTGLGTVTYNAINGAANGTSIDPALTLISPQLTVGQLSSTNSNVKNLIIGGNFDTNPWQRGTVFNAIADGFIIYTADRFQWQQSAQGSGANVNVTKTADAPTVAQAGIFVENCCQVTVANPTTLSNAAEYYLFGYIIEGFDWAQIAQRPFTISFWVKATVVGTYSIGLLNSNSTTGYVTTYFVNASNTWQKVIITIAPSPSAGTWNYTNGIGLQIYFAQGSGTDYQTSTLNSWTNTGNFVASTQVNNMATAANIFEIALLQVEQGSVVNPFQIRTETEELVLCQRYFEMSYAPGSNAPSDNTTVGSFNYSNSSVVAGTFINYIKYQTQKRLDTTPPVIYSIAGTSGKVTQSDGSEIAVTVGTYGSSGCTFTGTNGALLYGCAGHFAINTDFT